MELLSKTMQLSDIRQSYLQCPACSGQLNHTQCNDCSTVYPETLGIVDLRWPLAPLTKEDAETVPQLISQFNKSDFARLVELRFKHTSAPKEFLHIYQKYQSSMYDRGYSMIKMFRQRLQDFFQIPDDFLALDLGCGVGTSSAVLASQFKWVIAVDPSLSDLILAKKYFEEQEIQNVVLVRSAAQNLPVRSDVVSFAVSLNVIEHLFDVQSALVELNRVLKQGGCFCGDSRNRFDPIFPEPHAQLRWVGFWPRRFQPWYVKKLRNVSYSSSYLLSFFELQKYARATFGKSYTIVMPLVSAYGHSTQLDEITRALEKLPLLRNLAIFFFPSHLLIAQK